MAMGYGGEPGLQVAAGDRWPLATECATAFVGVHVSPLAVVFASDGRFVRMAVSFIADCRFITRGRRAPTMVRNAEGIDVDEIEADFTQLTPEWMEDMERRIGGADPQQVT